MESLFRGKYSYCKVVNIEAKEEKNTYLEQFLLCPQCFQNSSAAKASKCVYMLERVKLMTFLLIYILLFMEV